MAKKSTESQRTNLWGFLRDIVLAAINKGQLPVLAILIVFIILVVKIPPRDVSHVLSQGTEALEHYHILGWITSLLTTFGWYRHYKWLRKTHQIEMDRVTSEKSKMQNEQSDQKLSTTRK